MAYLKYYLTEGEEFKEHEEKELPNTKATEIVIEKLLKHFKLRTVRIEFTSGRNHSCAGGSHICINVEQQNFLVICHEVAHIYQHQKLYMNHLHGEKYHTKEHKRIMKRILNYCKRKNWFSEELDRRLKPRPQKPEPTKKELRSKKINLLENRKLKYQRKIKFSENKIKKINRQISALKRFI